MVSTGAASVQLSDEDRALLAEHAAIRKKYGWGRGPEQVFYTPLPLSQALSAAVGKGFLTAEEAQTEERVLSHFRQRVDALSTELQPNLGRLQQSIKDHDQELITFGTEAQGFVGAAPAKPIPFYMIVNPDDTSLGAGTMQAS